MRRCVPLLVLLALAACTKILSEESAQKLIASWLNDQIGIPVSSVSCPKDRVMKANDTFECTAAAKSGGELKVKVTQKDDQGNIAAELSSTDSLMDIARLEKLIAEWLKAKVDFEATVTCGGGKVRVSVKNGTFVCTAKGSKGDEAPVTVTMNDDQGAFSLTLNERK
jgi:hypothetical protein